MVSAPIRLGRLRGCFPGMPCYDTSSPCRKVPSCRWWSSSSATSRTRTELYYIDSCPCDNHRIGRHKVFADLAQRGKTSMGW